MYEGGGEVSGYPYVRQYGVFEEAIPVVEEELRFTDGQERCY